MAKDRTLSKELDSSIYNMRVAGLSERSIYEGLREYLEEPPSYRDVRASFKRQGVETRRLATEARKRGEFDNPYPDQRPISKSDYRDRLEIVREVDRTANAKDALDRNYVLGYMARAGVDPTSVEDPALRESLESIYSGTGS
jgi:hypothetical protein